MGRPRTPTEKLRQRGTYRQDRHGDRGDEAVASGRPRCPTWLSADADARWMWGTIMGSIDSSILAKADTAVLAGACRWWSTWRRFDQELMEDRGDTYKLTVQAAAAWKAFLNCAVQLGLSPVARTRLRARAPAVADPDGKGRFFSPYRTVG